MNEPKAFHDGLLPSRCSEAKQCRSGHHPVSAVNKTDWEKEVNKIIMAYQEVSQKCKEKNVEHLERDGSISHLNECIMIV